MFARALANRNVFWGGSLVASGAMIYSVLTRKPQPPPPPPLKWLIPRDLPVNSGLAARVAEQMNMQRFGRSRAVHIRVPCSSAEAMPAVWQETLTRLQDPVRFAEFAFSPVSLHNEPEPLLGKNAGKWLADHVFHNTRASFQDQLAPETVPQTTTVIFITDDEHAFQDDHLPVLDQFCQQTLHPVSIVVVSWSV